MYLKINLSRGIVVDDCDIHLLEKFAFGFTDSGYPITQSYDKTYYLHKMIIATKLKVDHKDGNKCNAKRDNLRVATNSQNAYNRGKTLYNTSGYKGVSKNRNLWSAKIKVDKKAIYIGSFVTKGEAAFKYDVAAKLYHGDFANLNFNLELST